MPTLRARAHAHASSSVGDAWNLLNTFPSAPLRPPQSQLDEEKEHSQRPTPTPQESEIARAEWLPVDEFLGSKYYKKGPYGAMLKAAVATAEGTGDGAGLVEHEGNTQSIFIVEPKNASKL